MVQAGHTDAQVLCLLAQAAGQFSVDLLAHFFEFAAVALYIVQVERQGGLVDVAEQFAEESFVGFEADAQTRLRHVVAVRHRGGQVVFLAQHAGFDFAGNNGQ
ncbi:hypothetical protein ALO42_200078 [Pseudomonas syringae pv. atrofaciens]|nr:hypothetical protein ALO42_200078 [Pseudomonas syringae pv. atrofaciens]